jgi:hypothetical protein
MNTSTRHSEDHLNVIFLYALQALSPTERSAAESQLAACADCRREVEALAPVVGSLVSWPTDVLRPAATLWDASLIGSA